MEILKLKLFLFLPKLDFAFRLKKNILNFQITSLGYSNYPIGIWRKHFKSGSFSRCIFTPFLLGLRIDLMTNLSLSRQQNNVKLFTDKPEHVKYLYQS